MSCLDKLRKLESSVRRCPEFQPISFFLEFISWNFFRRFPRVTAAELRKHNDVCSICLGEMSRARKTWSVIHMLFLKPPPPHHTHTFLHFQANKPSILGAAISSIRPVWRRPSTLSMLVQCANRISQHGRWKPEQYMCYSTKNYLDSLYMSSAAKSYSAKFCKIK